MKLTDLFIRRPVLAIVVNLVILIAGLQAIRSLSVRQYPRSDIAVVQVTTAYVGANADLVRGFITTPLERVIASADGIDYIESSSAQGLSTIPVHLKLNYDTNAALTQVQAKVAQVRNDLPPEAEAPIIDLQTADSQFAAMYMGFSSAELDQNQITDYLTPRRAAQAVGHQRGPARRHPRRARLRDAHLAQAREDGGPRDLAVRRPDGARAEQLSVRPGQDQGVDGLGEPGGQHEPPDRRGVPTARRQAEGRRRRAAGRDLRRRAGGRDLRAGRPLQRADRDVHGHLGPSQRQLARGHQARAGGDPRDPGAAARGHEGRHPVRLDGLHPGRDQRGLEDPERDAPDRRRGHLPLPGLVPRGAHPHRRDPDLAHRRRLPDAGLRLHDQPADPARHRALGRSRGRRRDRHGRERGAAPPARRQAVRGGDQGRARAGRPDHRDDDHAGRRLRADRDPGRPDGRALPRVRVHARRRGHRLGRGGADAVADDGLEAPARRRHREGLRRRGQSGVRRRSQSVHAPADRQPQLPPGRVRPLGDRRRPHVPVLHVLAEGAGAGRGPGGGLRDHPGGAQRHAGADLALLEEGHRRLQVVSREPEHLPAHGPHRRLRRHGHQALERAQEEHHAAPDGGGRKVLADPGRARHLSGPARRFRAAAASRSTS